MALTENDYKWASITSVIVLIGGILIMLIEVVWYFVFDTPISMANCAMGVGLAAVALACYCIISIVRINKALNIKNL